MPKKHLTDFDRGYNYARQWHTKLLAEKSPHDIFEIARVFSHFRGELTELSRGMGTYYLEFVMKKIVDMEMQNG
jgi:hypothetical protein